MLYLWPLISSLGFACMGVCIKLGSTQFSVAETVFYRSVIVWLLLEGYRQYKRETLVTPHLKAHLLRSAVGTVGMSTYFTSIALIPLPTAVTLAYTGPLFMALILAFWYQEKLTFRVSMALLIGFGGVVVLLQPSLQKDQWLGLLIGLVAGFVSALAMLNVRKLGQLGEPEWRTVYLFSVFATVVGAVWTLGAGGFHRPNAWGALQALGMGVFGMIGQIFLTVAYKRGKALLNANLSYTTVVFATLLGSFFWVESHPLLAWLGMALIVFAGMMMSWFSRRPTVVEAD